MQTKTVKLEDAVVRVFYQDLTKIVRGKFKRPHFIRAM
jgi:hypothetical protein